MDEMSVHKQIQFDGNQFVGGTETRFKIFFSYYQYHLTSK